MAHIVITELMDASAVARLQAVHDVLFAPQLVDDTPRLLAEAAMKRGAVLVNTAGGCIVDKVQGTPQ